MKKQSNRIMAKKSFGQHYLTDPFVLDSIVKTIDPTPADSIVEIGPGGGVLTDQLVKHAQQVIGIEFDRDLLPVLEKKFQNNKNFTLLQGDILKFKPDSLQDGAYKLVGNIPYNLTTKLFEKILLWEHKPSAITFLIQKEVGEKIVKKYTKNSPLALLVDMIGEAKIMFQVPPHAFYPPPKVNSVVVHIDCGRARMLENGPPEHRPSRSGGLDLEGQEFQQKWQFYDFVHKIFRMGRKTILNNLISLMSKEKALSVLKQCSLDPSSRPENLTFEELLTLFRVYKRSKIIIF